MSTTCETCSAPLVRKTWPCGRDGGFMNRLILAIDCETSGLNTATDRIVELGYCLFDVDRKALVLSGGAYVTGVPISPEIERITEIRPDWLAQFGRPLGDLLRQLNKLATSAVALAAHNVEFDRTVLREESKRCDPLLGGFGPLFEHTWIDTMVDLPFKTEPESKKLRYLALDLGLPPTIAHRAQFDAITCAQLLGRFDFDEVLARALSPCTILRADVSFDDKDKAKALGFRWQTIDGVEKVFTKAWVKRVKNCDASQLHEAARAAGVRLVEVMA